MFQPCGDLLLKAVVETDKDSFNYHSELKILNGTVMVSKTGSDFWHTYVPENLSPPNFRIATLSESLAREPRDTRCHVVTSLSDGMRFEMDVIVFWTLHPYLCTHLAKGQLYYVVL